MIVMLAAIAITIAILAAAGLIADLLIAHATGR
jgi:hypothetical protein